jgi:hypothetical protein
VSEISNLLPAGCEIRCLGDAEIKQLLNSGSDQTTDGERIELLADGGSRALNSDEICKMTLRIERDKDGETTFLRLIGRIRQEHLEELNEQIRAIEAPIVIDLEGVTLVDADAVRFLAAIESRGIEVLHCAPYISEWIRRENEEAKS